MKKMNSFSYINILAEIVGIAYLTIYYVLHDKYNVLRFVAITIMIVGLVTYFMVVAESIAINKNGNKIAIIHDYIFDINYTCICLCILVDSRPSIVLLGLFILVGIYTALVISIFIMCKKYWKNQGNVTGLKIWAKIIKYVLMYIFVIVAAMLHHITTGN